MFGFASWVCCLVVLASLWEGRAWSSFFFFKQKTAYAFVDCDWSSDVCSSDLFFIYTIWLKRKTPQNIVIGGAAGALPPVIGWTIEIGRASCREGV